jgi:coenzyme F420-reducing hydrogenase alpha subunit
LDIYKNYIGSTGLAVDTMSSKLRDVEEKYTNDNHMFSFNREMLGSFDICGSCEAHALLFGMEHGLSQSVTNSTTLFDLDFEKYRQRNKVFLRCPRDNNP